MGWRRLLLLALAGLQFALAVPLAVSAAPAEPLLLKDREYAGELLRSLRSARQRILLAVYLFKTTDRPSNLPRQVAEELIRARQRGVAVTVILEQSRREHDSLDRDNQRTAALLRRGGVTVRFDSPATTTHTKVAVIDGRYVLLGSHNLTQGALRHNHELSLLVDSPALAREVETYLNDL